jgi:ABC-type Zn uptake system ZnuABC Zn-binding protein ZnuA
MTAFPYKTTLAALGLCLLLCGQCLAAEPLTVVTTTPVLKSLAETIGGDKVKAASLGAGDEDPHFIQAKPSFMILARNADLWIRVGMELEIGYEGLILDGSRNAKIRVGQPGHLDLSESVIKLEVPKEKISRDMGDVHPMGNPHYWLDPLNGRLMAKAIADRLAQLDPADADTFQKNYKAFEKALDERMFGQALVEKVGGDKLWALQLKHQLPAYLDENKLRDKLGGWQGRLLPLAGKAIVTEHKSWIYFTNRFGLSVAGELEPKPGIPPSPAHLAEVIDLVKKNGIKLILLEPFYERKAADLVGEKTGAKVVVCASAVGGQKEASDYLALMDLIAGSIADALGAPATPTPTSTTAPATVKEAE